jgi:hypothetical protein
MSFVKLVITHSYLKHPSANVPFIHAVYQYYAMKKVAYKLLNAIFTHE